MPKLKTQALCIRTIDYSETSQVVWLFSPQFGRITAMAKGSKRGTKKRPSTPMQAACLYDLVYYQKPEAEMGLLNEAKLLEHFPGLRTGLPQFYAALFHLEICRKAVLPHAEAEAYFYAMLRSLRFISESGHVTLAIAYIKMETLRFLGSLPEINGCVACGAVLKREKRPAQLTLSTLAGGLLCQYCRSSHSNTYQASRQSLSAYEALLHWGLPGNPEHAKDFLCASELINPLFQDHFDKPFKLAPYCS